jgi:hypothetical protein
MRDTATGQAILAEGRKEGLQEGLRRGILDILDARGLSLSVELRARLDAEADADRLAWIHRAALRVGPDLVGLFPD